MAMLVLAGSDRPLPVERDEFAERFAARADAACARILASVGLDPDGRRKGAPPAEPFFLPSWEQTDAELEAFLEVLMWDTERDGPIPHRLLTGTSGRPDAVAAPPPGAFPGEDKMALANRAMLESLAALDFDDMPTSPEAPPETGGKTGSDRAVMELLAALDFGDMPGKPKAAAAATGKKKPAAKVPSKPKSRAKPAPAKAKGGKPPAASRPRSRRPPPKN